MNLIYIHTDVESDLNVLKELTRRCDNIYEMGSDEICEEKFAQLTEIFQNENWDVAFSLKYYPVVSMICQAMGIKYISWICKSYDPDIYSCTMINECNYVFFVDSVLHQKFSQEGFSHVFFLPLGVDGEQICERGDDEQTTDLVMIQDIFKRAQIPEYQTILNSDLKDATKGYLEGNIACYYQMAGLPSMTHKLPPYVKEDLYANLLCIKRADSVETLEDYYDSNFFNPIITYADRDIHLNLLAKNEYFKEVELYTRSDYRSSEIKCHKIDNVYNNEHKLWNTGKINLVITDRNWKTAIPQISWDIMAEGGFLITNYQKDYFQVLKEVPVMYIDERELLSKSIYYINHPVERNEIVEQIQQEIIEKHTYKQRINEIFEKI